jgi:hypothetical protein
MAVLAVVFPVLGGLVVAGCLVLLAGALVPVRERRRVSRGELEAMRAHVFGHQRQRMTR